MLVELHVVDLGIVADLDLVLGGGLTAITGETGAGKTLLVEALELLVGGRADASLVRDGVGELAECGAGLVDLHGQHAHQTLLDPAVQRGALDRYAGEPALTALAEYRA